MHTRHAHTQHTSIVIVGAIGGRFDHSMASINALFKYRHAATKVYLLDDHIENMVLLLPEVWRGRDVSARAYGPNLLCVNIGPTSLTHTNDCKRISIVWTYSRRLL